MQYGLESGRPHPLIARNERLLAKIRNLYIFAIAVTGVVGWHGVVTGFTVWHWAELAVFFACAIVTERARISIARNLAFYRAHPIRSTHV